MRDLGPLGPSFLEVAVLTAARLDPHLALPPRFLGGTGAGDRLGLKCDVTGDSLPAAVLPYTGRPMLELLIRDLQVGALQNWLKHLKPTMSAFGGNREGTRRRGEPVVDS
jgi:hypothetical protein